jgi:hypothetical protein
MNKRLPGSMPYRRMALLLGLCALAGLIWGFASKPVLLHTHLLTKADYQSCGAYNEQGTGITVLNPFRSRIPERTADVFLRAASSGKCVPNLSEAHCKFVTERPLPATEWRLVNRWDSAKGVKLFYRLSGEWQKRGKNNGCVIAEVDLEFTGANWRVSGHGVSW